MVWDGTGVDPWLPDRLAAEARVTEAEQSIFDGWWGAFSAWIVTVNRGVTAGVVPDPYAVFTYSPLWADHMHTFVAGPVTDTIGLAYDTIFGPDYLFDDRPAVTQHLAQVINRLSGVPDAVFDKVAAQIAEGAGSGESIPDIAERVDQVLSANGTPTWRNRGVTVARTECLAGDSIIESDGIKAVYRRWYEGPAIRVHMASGYEFTGTPNHPVLTPSGWVPLGMLEPGDNLVRHGGGQQLRASGDVHVSDVPAAISQVYDALAAVGVVVRAKTGQPDFHGDGMNGYVDVATTDRELGHRLEADSAQHVGNVVLELAHPRANVLHRSGQLLAIGRVPCPPHNPERLQASPYGVGMDAVLGRQILSAGPVEILGDKFVHVKVHPARSPLAKYVELGVFGGRAASDGYSGRRQNPADRVLVGAKPRRQGSFAMPLGVSGDNRSRVDVGSLKAAGQRRLGAQRYPGVGEYGLDPSGVDAVRLLDGADALTRPVGGDYVVRVDRYTFAGHVFNLFTERGWFGLGPFYSANTIGALNAGRSSAFVDVADYLGDDDFEQQWLATLDARVRRDHLEADLQRVPLGTPFTVCGEHLMFPGDPTGSPACVINCRCTTLLVRPGEDVDLSNRGFPAIKEKV